MNVMNQDGILHISLLNGQARAILTESGFKSVEVFGGMTFDPPKPQDERLHILAVRE